MTHNSRIAHLVSAVILTMSVAGSATARDSVTSLSAQVSANTNAIAQIKDQIEIIQFNQDHNIVRFAQYVANDLFNSYIIHLDRISEGCRVYVADRQIAATLSAADILMDPQAILDAADVAQFINQPSMVPLHVECLSEGDLVKGNVTGMLYRPQAIPVR
jgi:hypothetical protein